MAFFASVVHPVVSIRAFHTVRLIHEVGLRAAAIGSIPNQRIPAQTLLFIVIPVSRDRARNAVISIQSCWALTITSSPYCLWSRTNTLVLWKVPCSWCRAWNTVISEKVLIANTLISIPNSLGGWTDTFVASEIPLSWIWARLTIWPV